MNWPMEQWERIKDKIADLLDNAFLNKLREAIREVEKFADKIAGDVTAVIQAVKCCLPDPIQMGLNALNVVMEAFFCPLTKAVGVLEDLIMQVANKFVTTIVNMIPDSEEYTLGVDLGHYNSHFYVPSCSGHMSLNLDMDFSYTIGTRQLKNALKSRFSGIEAEDSALKHTSDWHSMVSFSYHSVVDCWRIGSDKVMSITDTCDCDRGGTTQASALTGPWCIWSLFILWAFGSSYTETTLCNVENYLVV